MLLAASIRNKKGLTNIDSGPVHGVASPMLFVGVPLHHSLNLNHVARPGARGVRRRKYNE